MSVSAPQLPKATPEQLSTLTPLAGMSKERLAELAQVAVVERAARGSDPLKGRLAAAQSIFLLSGELLIAYEGGGTMVLVGGSEDTFQALNRQKSKVGRSKAITDVDLLAIDDEVLDILATWDQVAASGSGEGGSTMARAVRSDARLITGAFSLANLRSGAFAQLPVAHIDELLKRFERARTARGDVVIKEGDEGDYYYVIEAGRFQVERLVGGAKVALAELKSGDAFGEEALVSEAKRNATVTSLGEGDLLRLDRKDFDELLRDTGAPLLDLADWPSTLGVIAEPMPKQGNTPLAVALLIIWALGCAAVVGAWIARAYRVRALLRASTPYVGSLPRNAGALDVRTSHALLEPALVGIVRPVLLLPRGIAEHLTRAQLEAVLEHELSHWRRRDNLTAAVHMLVEAVFWFHPLVWWIGARLVEERERACDEAVVRAGHDGRTYAEGILNVCERYVASALKCAAGISGADLKARVIEIARSRVMTTLSIQKKILLGAFALSTAFVPIIFGAAAQDDPKPLVRIQPNYPDDALKARREGFVDLQFTIAANGATRDVVVVASSAPEFEAPAVAALLRWRFLPTNMTCDGTVCTTNENEQPYERPGIRTVIRYQLRDVNPQAESQ